MNTAPYRGLLLATSAVLAISAAAPGLAWAAAAEPSSANTVQDIVVTAQKREQKLQDVPISVTVLGAQQLDALQIRSGTDIARQTPNLRVSNLGTKTNRSSPFGVSRPRTST